MLGALAEIIYKPMTFKISLLTITLLCLLITIPKNTISQDSLKKFEGKFLKIEKINSKEYYLYLKNENDTVKFLTIIPLDKAEIQLLKRTGNNITLTYFEYYNPVRKITDKIVKSMTPNYDFKKQ